jgi:hypothetical protein
MVARQLLGPGSLQEIDQHSFFEPIAGMAAFLTLAGFLVLLWVGLAYIIGIFMGSCPAAFTW